MSAAPNTGQSQWIPQQQAFGASALPAELDTLKLTTIQLSAEMQNLKSSLAKIQEENRKKDEEIIRLNVDLNDTKKLKQ